jgi:hypothetical protein
MPCLRRFCAQWAASECERAQGGGFAFLLPGIGVRQAEDYHTRWMSVVAESSGPITCTTTHHPQHESPSSLTTLQRLASAPAALPAVLASCIVACCDLSPTPSCRPPAPAAAHRHRVPQFNTAATSGMQTTCEPAESSTACNIAADPSRQPIAFHKGNADISPALQPWMPTGEQAGTG